MIRLTAARLLTAALILGAAAESNAQPIYGQPGQPGQNRQQVYPLHGQPSQLPQFRQQRPTQLPIQVTPIQFPISQPWPQLPQGPQLPPSPSKGSGGGMSPVQFPTGMNPVQFPTGMNPVQFPTGGNQGGFQQLPPQFRPQQPYIPQQGQGFRPR